MDEVLSPIGFFGLLFLGLAAFTLMVIGARQVLEALAEFVEWRREKRRARLGFQAESSKADGQ